LIDRSAASALGRAIALALAGEGCNLALHYNHSVEGVLEVQEAARAAGVQASTFQADLSDPDQLQLLMQSASAEFGHIDILINNAGITSAVRAWILPQSSLTRFQA